MADSLVLKGTMRVHTDWVTPIATPEGLSDFVVFYTTDFSTIFKEVHVRTRRVQLVGLEVSDKTSLLKAILGKCRLTASTDNDELPMDFDVQEGISGGLCYSDSARAQDKYDAQEEEAWKVMVSKVLKVLTSSKELIDLIKNVDTVFHSKPSGSSKSMLNNLYRFVPLIREQLQDWEDGLCESDADGSFLHENWNKDLQLFSDGDDGGQQLLQIFLCVAC